VSGSDPVAESRREGVEADEDEAEEEGGGCVGGLAQEPGVLMPTVATGVAAAEAAEPLTGVKVSDPCPEAAPLNDENEPETEELLDRPPPAPAPPPVGVPVVLAASSKPRANMRNRPWARTNDA
jgi:hypothetical protein